MAAGVLLVGYLVYTANAYSMLESEVAGLNDRVVAGRKQSRQGRQKGTSTTPRRSASGLTTRSCGSNTCKDPFLRKLPGGIGSSLLPDRERHEKAMREACYTLEQVEKMLQQWRYDFYGLRPRRRIMSPLLVPDAPVDCWKRLSGEYVLPDPPLPSQIAEISMAPAAARTVQHYGVEFNSVQYHGPELRGGSGNLDRGAEW